jgi:hypothetical protein
MEIKYMNQPSMTTTRRKIQVAFFAIVSLALLPTIVTAHGGEEHVTGTVAKISDTSVTVKTKEGKAVDVALDAKTTFARGKTAIAKSDIKVGDRIVIHATEVDEKLFAHTVEVGTVPATKQVTKN